MNPLRRKLAIGTSVSLAFALTAPLALAQSAADYPSGVIRLVIPTPAGGGIDIMSRLIGDGLSKKWGQPVIVEPRPGASGAIAVTAVAGAAPDGRTLLVTHSGYLTNLAVRDNPGYKAEDLTPVSLAALLPIAIGAKKSLGVSDFSEFIELVKAEPGKYSYGSYGQGSGGHFVGELMRQETGVDMIHVPYKGEAPAITDLVGGQIDSAVVSIGGLYRHPDHIVPLAISSPVRSTRYGDVPTFAEVGYDGVSLPGWSAVMAPAGTPQEIIDKLAEAIDEVVNSPGIADKILELGFEPNGMSGSDLRDFLDTQYDVLSGLVQSGRVQVSD